MVGTNFGESGLLGQLNTYLTRPLEEATGLPPAIYWDEEIASLETERIWRRDWVCPGRVADIPETGDYITFTIGNEDVFTVRSKDGGVRTFSNVCRHRMMQLMEGTGNKRRIICPYHAWTYDLDGKLIGAGHMERSKGFEKKDHCLPEIRTEIWHGWIYITLNPDAVPVSQALAELETYVGRYQMEDYIPVTTQDHVWQTNWKLLTENFMEGYHLPVAHKQTVGAWFPVEDTVFPEKQNDAFTFQTYSKDENAVYGLAHPDNKRLTGKWRHTSILPTVFPAHMYVLAPDHLWYLSLRPKGVGEVHVRFGVAVAPEVYQTVSDPEMWTRQLLEFFDIVNSEDRMVVEGIFAGSRSGFAVPGPLSWLEREIYDFGQYLARRLRAE